MTDKRKKEIWQSLPVDLKREAQGFFFRNTKMKRPQNPTQGLIALFGYDNLTAQTKENCTNRTENGISGSKIQPESAESVETSTKVDACYNQRKIGNADKSPIDYAQYRRDLAKEIAVAVIRSDRWDFKSCDPVEQANEIVKRLKETDNENA